MWKAAEARNHVVVLVREIEHAGQQLLHARHGAGGLRRPVGHELHRAFLPGQVFGVFQR